MGRITCCLFAIAMQLDVAGAQEQPPRWATEGPYVDAASFSLAVPVERFATMIYVEVELGGAPRRFVFDTGSPSMIDRELASELGLKVVDRKQGRDSHGTLIESDVVQADLGLGGVTFRKVPLFATDFRASSAAQCPLGDGVLGSEILPLCAWQIDLPEAVLRCNTDLGALAHIATASKQQLYDFGFPHAPILDVRFADRARSKAMFDTGSPEYFVLSPPDFEGARRARGIGRTVSGYGSLGGSLGGPAPEGEQTRAELKTLSIGTLALDSVRTIVRESPPSLIGASILEHFVVTLDQRSQTAYFDQYRGGPYARPSFGFTLGFDGEISIGLVWEGSPAAQARLSAGTRLTEINGTPTAPSCDGIRKALDAMSAETIELTWEGGAAKLVSRR